jgi:hypothetical protein
MGLATAKRFPTHVSVSKDGKRVDLDKADLFAVLRTLVGWFNNQQDAGSTHTRGEVVLRPLVSVRDRSAQVQVEVPQLMMQLSPEDATYLGNGMIVAAADAKMQSNLTRYVVESGGSVEMAGVLVAAARGDPGLLERKSHGSEEAESKDQQGPPEGPGAQAGDEGGQESGDGGDSAGAAGGTADEQ